MGTRMNMPKGWIEFDARGEVGVREDLATNKYGEFEQARAKQWLDYRASERASATNAQHSAEAARAATAAERAAIAAERAAVAAEEQASQAQRANRIAATALIIAIIAAIMSLIALAKKIT